VQKHDLYSSTGYIKISDHLKSKIKMCCDLNGHFSMDRAA
jgi:hypothetical protein